MCKIYVPWQLHCQLVEEYKLRIMCRCYIRKQKINSMHLIRFIYNRCVHTQQNQRPEQQVNHFRVEKRWWMQQMWLYQCLSTLNVSSNSRIKFLSLRSLIAYILKRSHIIFEPLIIHKSITQWNKLKLLNFEIFLGEICIENLSSWCTKHA